jgi:hypothetical protein
VEAEDLLVVEEVPVLAEADIMDQATMEEAVELQEL